MWEGGELTGRECEPHTNLFPNASTFLLIVCIVSGVIGQAMCHHESDVVNNIIFCEYNVVRELSKHTATKNYSCILAKLYSLSLTKEIKKSYLDNRIIIHLSQKLQLHTYISIAVTTQPGFIIK